MIGEEPRTGPADVTSVLTNAMEEAGVHPAYVFAVRRCGFVLTQGNETTLKPEQVQRWNAAIEEFFAAVPDV